MNINNLNSYDNASNTLIEKVLQETDNVFIEALKNKGYIFENTMQMENFVKEFGTCIDDHTAKQKIYSIKNVPFLMHDYNEEYNFDKSSMHMSAIFGKFYYL